jgi:probable F420-dependent oxidoreductase
MRPIRIAAQLHPQHGRWEDLRAGAVEAERLGFDIVYTWDHFFPLYGPSDGAHFECWTTLAALAEATERVELGPLVSANSYRNPQLVADMARTLDHVSGGRMILGLGAGWFRRDYEEYGYEFGTPGTRLAALEAAIPPMLDRLERLVPPPVRRPPVLIAGAGERRTLRLVAQYADVWHAGFPDHAAELEPKVAALRRWCADLGRDSRAIEWSVGVEPDDLDRFLAEEAPACVAMGFTQFTLGFSGPDWPVAGGARWLEWRADRNDDGRAAQPSERSVPVSAPADAPSAGTSGTDSSSAQPRTAPHGP